MLKSESSPAGRVSKIEWTALLIAIIWLLHPLQTQSVTYVVQRAESLMGLFFLATLYCFIRGSDQFPEYDKKENQCRIWLAIAVICCALGMATKAVMVTAPVVVLLYDRTFVASSFVGAIHSRPIFYLTLAATWGVLAILGVFHGVVATQPGSVGLGVNISPTEYLLTQAGVIMHYIRLFLWPHPLCLDYAWPIAKSIREVWIPGAAILLLLAATIWSLLRKPKIGFLAAAFFIILAPTSSFIPVQDPIFEHRMYLPLAALVAMGVIAARWVLIRLPAPGRIGLALLIPLILGAMTFRRNRDWANDLTLWTDGVRQTPHSARAHINLGRAYYGRARYEEAIAEYDIALSIRPDDALTENNLGGVLFQQGKIDEAAVHFAKAVKLKPHFAVAHNSLGSALLQQGKSDEAMRHYREAIRLNPDYPDPHSNIALLIVRRGDTARAAEAERESREALRLNPDYVDARYNHANALMMLGRTDEALADYRRVLKLNPRHNMAQARLNQALMDRTGR